MEARLDIVERLRKEDDELKRQTAFTDIGYKITVFEDAADEIERLRAEHAETNTLLHEIAELRAALRSVVEAWSGAYAGEMAVNRAIEKAEKLLPQTVDEG